MYPLCTEENSTTVESRSSWGGGGADMKTETNQAEMVEREAMNKQIRSEVLSLIKKQNNK